MRTWNRAVAWILIVALATPSAWAGRVAAVDEALRRAEAFAKRYEASRYDLDAFAKTLPPGAEPAFAFVRDQVRFEAYPGVLRGARTTFATRAGNAYDRSLLLADLLDRQGIPTRFALARLAPERTSALFERMFAPRSKEAGASGPPGTALPSSSGAFLERVSTRAARDYAALKKALGNDLPSRKTDSAAVRDEISDHVWVQAQVEGRWIDLDSAFADAKPGVSFAQDAKTLDAVPAEKYQRVTLRVRAETARGSKLEVETPLEATYAAVSLVDHDVYLTHLPGGSGLDGALDAGFAGREGSIWTPLLWIDDTGLQGKRIDFSDAAGGAARGAPPRGGLPFGSGGALGSSRSQLVSEWLEVVTTVPGRRDDVVRRTLFDRAPPGWSTGATRDLAALRPMPKIEGKPAPPQAIHDLRFTAGRHDLYTFGQAVLAMAKYLPGDGSKAAFNESLRMQDRLFPFAVQSFAVVAASDHLVVPAVNDSPDHLLYADTPRLFVFSAGVDPARGQYVDMDLRRDELRAVARTPSGEPGLVERRMWFGLLEGALEHETRALYVEASKETGFTGVASTSGALNGAALTAIRSREALPAAWGGSDALPVLDEAFSEGDLVVTGGAPGPGAFWAWWQVAPDGTTYAVGGGLNAGSVFGSWGGTGPATPIGPGTGYGEPPTPWPKDARPPRPASSREPAKRQAVPEYPAMQMLGTTLTFLANVLLAFLMGMSAFYIGMAIGLLLG